jgi:hypothetical protein
MLLPVLCSFSSKNMPAKFDIYNKALQSEGQIATRPYIPGLFMLGLEKPARNQHPSS